MEATIINDSHKAQRNCLNCGAEIIEGNAKRVFCSDSCRSANHEKVKKQEKLLQAHALEEQRITIGRLTDAPVQRKEAVRVINPAWQLANRVYSAQKEKCGSLTDQLVSLQSKIQDARSGSLGAYYGAAIAAAFVLYLAARRYDTRKDMPIGTSFVVGSVSFLIGMSVIGYWIGQKIHEQLITYSEQDHLELARTEHKKQELCRKLVIEKLELDRLYKQLLRLNEYASETITTVDEIRVL